MITMGLKNKTKGSRSRVARSKSRKKSKAVEKHVKNLASGSEGRKTRKRSRESSFAASPKPGKIGATSRRYMSRIPLTSVEKTRRSSARLKEVKLKATSNSQVPFTQEKPTLQCKRTRSSVKDNSSQRKNVSGEKPKKSENKSKRRLGWHSKSFDNGATDGVRRRSSRLKDHAKVNEMSNSTSQSLEKENVPSQAAQEVGNERKNKTKKKGRVRGLFRPILRSNKGKNTMKLKAEDSKRLQQLRQYFQQVDGFKLQVRTKWDRRESHMRKP
mmetsp:Transcript_10236/g.12316  ORF Transcript_10236/g.12316 Transcript_10236/m.12316 type:complete len:271 (-) Transcript_10236:186-998(-)